MAEDFVQKGQLLVGGGEYQEAVKVARLGLLANPTSLGGRLVLARALLALGRVDEVLAEVRVVLELDSTSEDAHCLKAEAQIRKGAYAEAALTLAEAERHARGSARVAALRAQVSEHQHGAATAVSASPPPPPEPTGEFELSSVDMLPIDTGEVETAPEVPVLPPASHAPPSPPFSPPSAPPVAVGAVPRLAGPSAPTMAEDSLGAQVYKPPVPIDPLGSTMLGGEVSPVGGAVSKSDLAASGAEALGAIAGLDAEPVVPHDVAGSDGPTGADALTRRGKLKTGEEAPHGDHDMRTIRQGLGLSPDPTKLGPAVEDVEAEAKQGAAPSVRKPKQARSAKKSAARRRASKARRRRTSKLTLMIYILLAGAAIAGAIFAGFKVREIRLEQQIRYALTEGHDKAKADTLVGYRRALDAFEGILAVRQNPEALASKALVRSQLAFEYGMGAQDANEAVAAASTVDSADALIARAYLALVGYELEGARKLVAEATAKYPREDTRLAYIRGAAFLLEGEYALAAKAFEVALADRRPLPFVRLAECQLELGDYDSALASIDRALELVDRHPQAMIVRSRALLRAGRILESNSKAELSEVIAESMRGPAEQTMGATKYQASWAALVLAQVAQAAGDSEGAQKALGRALVDRARVLDPRFSLELITTLVAAGEIEKASVELQTLRAEVPESRLTSIAVAVVTHSQGRLAEAQAALATVGDLEGYPAGLALRGVVKLEAGMIDAAVADLDLALGTVPRHRHANLARARADLLRGEFRSAKRRLETLFDSLDSAPADVVIAYAESIAAGGDSQRARGIIADLARRGDSADALATLAALQLADGEFAGARKSLERALELEPDHVKALVQLIELALDDADRDKARSLLERLPDSTSGRIEAAAVRARFATLTGDFAKADDLLAAVKEAGGSGPLIDLESGRLALRRGDASTAVERLESASKALSSDVEARLLWLEALLANEGPAANSTVERAVTDIEKDFAGTPEVNLARGIISVQKKDGAAAVAALSAARARMKEVKRSKRDRAEVAYYLGRAHYIAGDLAKATASFQAAIDLDPNHALSHFFRGQILFESEDFEGAAAAYAKAVEADPSGVPRAWFYLGDVSHVLGRDQEAKKALQTYSERFPKGSDIEAVKRLMSKL